MRLYRVAEDIEAKRAQDLPGEQRPDDPQLGLSHRVRTGRTAQLSHWGMGRVLSNAWQLDSAGRRDKQKSLATPSRICQHLWRRLPAFSTCILLPHTQELSM